MQRDTFKPYLEDGELDSDEPTSSTATSQGMAGGKSGGTSGAVSGMRSGMMGGIGAGAMHSGIPSQMQSVVNPAQFNQAMLGVDGKEGWQQRENPFAQVRLSGFVARRDAAGWVHAVWIQPTRCRPGFFGDHVCLQLS